MQDPDAPPEEEGGIAGGVDAAPRKAAKNQDRTGNPSMAASIPRPWITATAQR